MNAPPPETGVPPVFLELAGGAPVRLVWRNQFGGLTATIGDDRFAKWTPHGGPDLHHERVRLEWAARFVQVPRVLDHGDDWLLTAALPGTSAVDQRWRGAPELAVAGIARGLRHLHDTLPVRDCPFDWSVESRLPGATSPPVDRLVVCHGDPCAPNTLLDGIGAWCGHVDLGALGVADRWADIAVATWSLEWNFGPGWDELFLDNYGAAPDPIRTTFYRELWRRT